MNVNMVGVHDIEIQQQKIHSMMTQKRIFFSFRVKSMLLLTSTKLLL